MHKFPGRVRQAEAETGSSLETGGVFRGRETDPCPGDLTHLRSSVTIEHVCAALICVYRYVHSHKNTNSLSCIRLRIHTNAAVARLPS